LISPPVAHIIFLGGPKGPLDFFIPVPLPFYFVKPCPILRRRMNAFGRSTFFLELLLFSILDLRLVSMSGSQFVSVVCKTTFLLFLAYPNLFFLKVVFRHSFWPLG